ncbi:MAG: glutaredoxin 3 [Rhizomicrobium sp.]|jgi:glutaredoxin 3
MCKVRIYTTPFCPFCARAKALLAKKGIAFDEIDVTVDDDARKDMQVKTSGAQTVPQIFIGERHVGGCEDLYALDKAGDLDLLLAE